MKSLKKNRIHLIEAIAATLALGVALLIALPREASAVVCWLDSPNKVVKCNGGSSDEAFIIGASGLNSTFTICYQNLNNSRVNKLFTFDRTLFDHMEITGNDGDDTIQVILSGFYNCYVAPYGWTRINPYGSTWVQYLEAWGGGDVDTISGTNNDDYLNGGPGTDTIHGKGGDDTIDGQDGDDYLYGEDGIDTIYGGGEDDTIDGGGAGDTLNGDPGNDTIHGQGGDDTINGQGGLDYLYGDEGCDTITGGEDNDNIYLSTSENGPDTCASPNRNRAYGGNGGDVIHGGVNAMNDIWGNYDNDCLYGKNMGDRICGGCGGYDYIESGDGADLVVDFLCDYDTHGEESECFHAHLGGSGEDTMCMLDTGYGNFIDPVCFNGEEPSTSPGDKCTCSGLSEDECVLINCESGISPGDCDANGAFSCTY